MKMRSLVSSLVLLACSGCVVPHSLGMSESESDDAGGDGEGGSESGGTGGVSMSDTGGGDSGEGGTDQPTTSATTDNPPSEDGEDIDSDGDDSSGGGDECNPLSEQFLWGWESMDLEGGENIWNSEALLAGECDVVFIDSDPLEPSIKGFALSCIFDGRTDGTDVTGVEVTPFFAAGGDLVQEALEARLPAYEGAEAVPVYVKLAQSNWGMGFDTWFVVADLDGTVLFDGVMAEEVDPADDIFLENDFEVLPDLLPWHGALSLAMVETDCDTFADVECNGVQQALAAAGPEFEFPTVGVEVGGSGFIQGAAGPLSVFLNEALDYSRATCSDHPLALVRYASYAP